MIQLLAIEWATIGIKAAQFILSFSILILLHEFGHFITARWFKARVEKFYLFFNPWFSLFKMKKGETEYGLGWIPLGGYVKISGMMDESMDKEAMKLPPQPFEFRAKPAWQRLIIMLGGVIVNIILALFIFIMILWVWGERFMPPSSAIYGIHADSLAKVNGFRDGDRVTQVGGVPVKDILNLRGQIVYNEGPALITVQREGKTLQLPYNNDLVRKLNTRSAGSFVNLRVPFVVKSFSDQSGAEKAGVKKGDRVIGADRISLLYYNEFTDYMKTQSGNKTIALKILRGTDSLQFPVVLDENGKIGAWPVSEFDELGFHFEKRKYGFLEAIPAGFSKCWNTLGKYVQGLKQLFNGKAKASESVGSVISIGSIYPDKWDWQIFWTLTAIFSIVLAFMNVLPIPGLDGGHALFTLAEMITGKKPSDKFLEYAQIVGMILLLGLMAYALGLDIFRLFN